MMRAATAAAAARPLAGPTARRRPPVRCPPPPPRLVASPSSLSSSPPSSSPLSSPPSWKSRRPLRASVVAAAVVDPPTLLPPFATRASVRLASSSSSSSSASSSSSSSSSPDDSAFETIPYLLADIGEGIAEVELMQWFVAPGDVVTQFQDVCEVQSDKATVTISSRYDGTVVDVCGDVGDMINVGSPLMRIAVRSEGGPAAPPSPPASAGGGDASSSSSSPSSASSSSSSSSSDPPGVVSVSPTLNNVDDDADRLRIPSLASCYPQFPTGPPTVGDDVPPYAGVAAAKVRASPAVRRLGKEHNLDLGAIVGSGTGGRVLKADVLEMIRSSSEPIASPPESAEEEGGGATAPPGGDGAAPPRAPDADGRAAVVPPGETLTVPLRGYRRLMVKSMTASLQIPHMVYSDEVDVTDLRAVRSQLRPIAERRGVRLSYLPFLIKATSLALMEYPELNASLDADRFELTYRGDHDLGVAMDTPRGLAVPVVRGCQDRTVMDIAEEINRLQELASAGSLPESDLTSPTFTISNIGTIGGTYTSPVVLPPQVAICALGRIRRLPRYVGDTDVIGEAEVMNVSWGADHRAVDGATVARFGECWRGYAERPVSMTLDMR